MNYSEIEEVDYNRVWVPYDIKNGRINIIDDDNIKYKKRNSTVINKSILPDDNTNLISQTISTNELSDTFFSKNNIDKIQLLIIQKVYNDSDNRFTINKQSEQELLIIMKSYYLQYSKNLSVNIDKQINVLNSMVVDWSANYKYRTIYYL